MHSPHKGAIGGPNPPLATNGVTSKRPTSYYSKKGIRQDPANRDLVAHSLAIPMGEQRVMVELISIRGSRVRYPPWRLLGTRVEVVPYVIRDGE